MNGVARISFENGALLMPARNAYDQELIFQEAESYARRHGQVKLEVQSQKMLITFPTSEDDSLCDRCAQRVRMVVTMASTHLCLRCARERVC